MKFEYLSVVSLECCNKIGFGGAERRNHRTRKCVFFFFRPFLHLGRCFLQDLLGATKVVASGSVGQGAKAAKDKVKDKVEDVQEAWETSQVSEAKRTLCTFKPTEVVLLRKPLFGRLLQWLSRRFCVCCLPLLSLHRSLQRVESLLSKHSLQVLWVVSDVWYTVL